MGGSCPLHTRRLFLPFQKHRGEGRVVGEVCHRGLGAGPKGTRFRRELWGSYGPLWTDTAPGPHQARSFSADRSLPCHTAHIKMKQQQFLLRDLN